MMNEPEHAQRHYPLQHPGNRGSIHGGTRHPRLPHQARPSAQTAPAPLSQGTDPDPQASRQATAPHDHRCRL